MRRASQPIHGSLAPWQERRAKAILNANLDREISLIALATEVRIIGEVSGQGYRTQQGQCTRSEIELSAHLRVDGSMHDSHSLPSAARITTRLAYSMAHLQPECFSREQLINLRCPFQIQSAHSIDKPVFVFR
jgi:hypothetical protein